MHAHLNEERRDAIAFVAHNKTAVRVLLVNVNDQQSWETMLALLTSPITRSLFIYLSDGVPVTSCAGEQSLAAAVGHCERQQQVMPPLALVLQIIPRNCMLLRRAAALAECSLRSCTPQKCSIHIALAEIKCSPTGSCCVLILRSRRLFLRRLSVPR